MSEIYSKYSNQISMWRKWSHSWKKRD